MAISEEKKKSFDRKINDLRALSNDELEKIVENCRWLTTLSLAEIGGIASYRELIEAKSLSIPFSIMIIFIAIAIVFFMVAIIMSRKSNSALSKAVSHSWEKLREHEGNARIAPIDGDIMVERVFVSSESEMTAYMDTTNQMEVVGLILFAVGSVGTAVVILATEGFLLFQ